MDYDYLKVDFLSRGALEGQYFNKDIKTGRQALMYLLNIIKEELDPKKIGFRNKGNLKISILQDP